MSEKVKVYEIGIDELLPDPTNANKGSLRGQKMIDDSIAKTGLHRGVAVDANGYVVAGNKTQQAAIDAGFKKALVVETDGDTLVVTKRRDFNLLSDDPNNIARQAAYYDNRSSEVSLTWDAEVLLADLQSGVDLSGMFNQSELDALLDGLIEKEPMQPAEAQTDKAAELQAKWQTQAGQLWQLGRHRLICGDCTDKATVERLMQGEKADCVFTSPPYAVGVDYGETYKDTIDNLRLMLPKLSKLWLDIVVDGGFAVLNFGDIAPARNITGTDEPCEYPMALEYWPVFRSDGWLLWSRRIWCKPNPRVHSLQCIGSNRAATDWEHLWTWRKSGKPIIERVDGDLRSPLGWYQSSLMTGVEVGKDDHGAGMATGIAQWMVNVHARQNHIVHEPFCGTGTTLIACESLNRRCFASEISPAYCAVILQRYQDSTGQTPVLL